MGGLRFIETIDTFTAYYGRNFRTSYLFIDSVNNVLTTRNSSASVTNIFNHLSGNAYMQTVLDNLKAEQTRNLLTTGPTRDSLMQLMNSVSNLYNGTRSFYERIFAGAINIDYQLLTADAAKLVERLSNTNSSIDRLSRLQLYLSNFKLLELNRIPASEQTALTTTIQFIDSLKFLIVLNTADITNVIGKKAEIVAAIKADPSFSDVVFADAASYVQDFEARGQLTITPDFGVISYGFLPWNKNQGFRSINTYIGFHVNWRPLDKNLHFRSIPNKCWYSLHHWSTMMGITLIADKVDGKRDSFFGKNNLMIGIGYRLGSFLRLVGGTMLFKKYDINILSPEKKTACALFAGISLDVDLKKFVNGIADAFASK